MLATYLICQRCGLRTYQPKHIEEKYCGRCNEWHKNMPEALWPNFCLDCGAHLQGGATIHKDGCSIQALIDDPWPEAGIILVQVEAFDGDPNKGWFSCRDFTIQVNVDDAAKIVFAAPIAKRFIGQPLGNLVRFMRKIGDFQFTGCEKHRDHVLAGLDSR